MADNDRLLENFRRIKRDIGERGVEAVAAEMHERRRVELFREAARVAELDFSLITDAEIIGWLRGADGHVRDGTMRREEASLAVATAAEITQRAREAKGSRMAIDSEDNIVYVVGNLQIGMQQFAEAQYALARYEAGAASAYWQSDVHRELEGAVTRAAMHVHKAIRELAAMEG